MTLVTTGTMPAPKGDDASKAEDDADSISKNTSSETDSAQAAASDIGNEKFEDFGPYCMHGIPTLEESIPMAHLPDILVVHDPCDLSMGNGCQEQGSTKTTVTLYERRTTGLRTTDKNTAHIYLSPYNEAGRGHHSITYRVPLTLSPPLTICKSDSTHPSTVGVIAKVAMQNENARCLLTNESWMYSEFPNHLNGYCGWHLLSPSMKSPGIVPGCNVVPKFYGYYEPVENKKAIPTGRADVLKEQGYAIPSWKKRSPILLVEDCGRPINPETMDVDQRAQCHSLLLDLHRANYLHNSFYCRNILIKPGPLTQHPEERSMKTPSFRIIDFGGTSQQHEIVAYEYDLWMLRKEKEREKEKARAKKVSESASSTSSLNTGEGTANEDALKALTEERQTMLAKLNNTFESRMLREALYAKRELLLNSIENI